MDIWIVISYPANYTILFFLWGLIPVMIQPVFHGCQAFFGGYLVGRRCEGLHERTDAPWWWKKSITVTSQEVKKVTICG